MSTAYLHYETNEVFHIKIYLTKSFICTDHAIVTIQGESCIKTALGREDFLREIVRFMVKTVAEYSGGCCVAVEDWDEALDDVRLS